MVLFVLLTGGLPFTAEDTLVMFEKISKGDYKIPPELPDPAQDLLRKLINPKPSARLTVEGIAAHKWFKTRTSRITAAQRKLFEAEFPPNDDFADQLHSKLLAPNMIIH